MTASAIATSVVSAEARVKVVLRDKDGQAAEGRVSLVDAQGRTVASCSTKAGKCQMSGVPGGTYLAAVKPREGKPPKPREVMIPPAGDVTLIVSAGE